MAPINATAMIVALRGGLIFSLKLFPRLLRGYAHVPYNFAAGL